MRAVPAMRFEVRIEYANMHFTGGSLACKLQKTARKRGPRCRITRCKLLLLKTRVERGGERGHPAMTRWRQRGLHSRHHGLRGNNVHRNRTEQKRAGKQVVKECRKEG